MYKLRNGKSENITQHSKQSINQVFIMATKNKINNSNQRATNAPSGHMSYSHVVQTMQTGTD